MEVSGQIHAPTALLPGKESPVIIGEEAGCNPELVWTHWRWEYSFIAPAGNGTLAVQPIYSSLYWLS